MLSNVCSLVQFDSRGARRYRRTVGALERLDVVDPVTGRVIGTENRAEIHRRGLWHQVFHCLVLRPSDRSVILQRRASTKIAFPSKLDLTVTGHLASGEEPADGRREMEEELGVEFEPGILVSLGTRLLAGNDGEGHNRELAHVFFALDDRPLTAYRPPPQEVDGLFEIPASGFEAIVGDGDAGVGGRFAAATNPTVVRGVTVGRGDLVPGNDGYWTVLAVMAGRALDGRQPLGI